MFTKTAFLFSVVAVVTLLTVEAEVLHPSDAMERKEMCKNTLAEACPGTADAIPFDFPAESKEIDNACTAATSLLPCFRNYQSSCDTDDVQSRYYLTYLEVCDSSTFLYNGVRKSAKCMKKASENYKVTCVPPLKKLVNEMEAFGKKINDFSISPDDWKKINFALLIRSEQLCYFDMADGCNKEFVKTMETLFDRYGATKVTAVLLEKKDLVEKILDNLNLENKQKMKLKNNLG